MENGKEAERLAWQWLTWLKNIGCLTEPRDVRDELDYREVDVDFLCKVGDLEWLIEVKSDVHLGVSGNVLFEVLRINHIASPDKAAVLGWSPRSAATHFLYYAPSRSELYWCESPKLRKAFQRYTSKVRKETNIGFVETDAARSTINIYIPWKYCQNIFTIFPVERFT